MHRTIGILSILLATTHVVPARSEGPAAAHRGLAIAIDGEQTVLLQSIPDLTTVRTIPTLIEPAFLAPLGGSRLFVLPDYDPTTYQILDLVLRPGSTKRIRTETPFWAQPNEDGTKLYVTNLDGGGAVVIDTATDRITRRLDTTPRPDSMALDAIRHELYVGDNAHSALTVYDTRTDLMVRQFDADSIQTFIVAGGKVYWTGGSSVLQVSDAMTFAPITTIETRHYVVRFKLSEQGDRIWATGFDVSSGTGGVLLAIDPSVDRIVDRFSLPVGAVDVAVDDAGKTAYLAQPDDHQLGIVDLTTGAFTSMPFEGFPSSVALVDVP